MANRVVKYRLGGALVVWAGELLIPDGVVVDIDLVVDDDDILPVRIKFVSEQMRGQRLQPLMRGTGVDGVLHMDFVNFEGSFSNSGASTPQVVGKTNAGDPISFIVAMNRLPGLRTMNLQFIVGDISIGDSHASED